MFKFVFSCQPLYYYIHKVLKRCPTERYIKPVRIPGYLYCDDCDFVYYGETDRALITTIKEHKRSVSHRGGSRIFCTLVKNFFAIEQGGITYFFSGGGWCYL